jgi:hypothetical protein
MRQGTEYQCLAAHQAPSAWEEVTPSETMLPSIPVCNPSATHEWLPRCHQASKKATDCHSAVTPGVQLAKLGVNRLLALPLCLNTFCITGRHVRGHSAGCASTAVNVALCD